MYDLTVRDCGETNLPKQLLTTQQLFETSPLHLIQGDCFQAMRELPDACIDLVVTDPPYSTTNLAFDKAARKNPIDWEAWWAEIHRVAKPTAIIVCFAAQPFTTDLINSNRKFFRYDLTWSKPYSVGFLSANVRPLRSHESILIFCRQFGSRRIRQGEHLVREAGSIYNPQFAYGHAPYLKQYREQPATHYSATKALPARQNDGRRHPTSVLTYGRDVKSWHPTQKPTELGRWLVKTYSHAEDVVLDPFAGGGGLVVPALEEGRRVIAIEQDPVHVETIQVRTERYAHREVL